MHVLRELRRRDSRRTMPELPVATWWFANPAAIRTARTSGIDAPHLQAGWLRRHSIIAVV